MELHDIHPMVIALKNSFQLITFAVKAKKKIMEKMELSLRDQLALDRTRLANQRTLLAMFRTGIYFMLVAITIISLSVLEELKWVAGALLAIGAIVMLLGVFYWNRQNKKLTTTYLVKGKWQS